MSTARLTTTNPALGAKLSQMALPLAPLVQITTGLAHPSFPKHLVNFWLLTSDELDDLAHFYYQRTPCEFTARYPAPMGWRGDLTLEEKRRKLGKFIGLRGCETPLKSLTEEEIREGARVARERAAEEELMRRGKGQWY